MCQTWTSSLLPLLPSLCSRLVFAILWLVIDQALPLDVHMGCWRAQTIRATTYFTCDESHYHWTKCGRAPSWKIGQLKQADGKPYGRALRPDTSPTPSLLPNEYPAPFSRKCIRHGESLVQMGSRYLCKEHACVCVCVCNGDVGREGDQAGGFLCLSCPLFGVPT